MFGERIKQARLALGYSAEQVAAFLHVSPATIYRYENGDISKLPSKFIKPLAEYLRISPAYLMGWVSDPSSRTDDASSSPDPISDAELRLISDYRQLNNKGKEYVQQQVRIAQVMFGEKSDTFPAEAISVK